MATSTSKYAKLNFRYMRAHTKELSSGYHLKLRSSLSCATLREYYHLYISSCSSHSSVGKVFGFHNMLYSGGFSIEAFGCRSVIMSYDGLVYCICAYIYFVKFVAKFRCCENYIDTLWGEMLLSYLMCLRE